MLKNRKRVVALKITNEKEIMGINSKSDLLNAEGIAKSNKFSRIFPVQQGKKLRHIQDA
ncbi:hypothetical protein ES703_104040 [subsurface metagenome]